MIKILHCSTARTWRGGEQQLAYLLKGLRTVGITQHVISAPRSPMNQFCQREDFAGAEWKSARALRPANIFQLHKIVGHEKPQIIHAHDAHAHTLACLYSSLFRKRLPVIVSRRVDFPVGGHWLSRWKYRHPAIKRFICVSEAIRLILSEDIPDHNKLVTVYDGIDLARFDGGPDGRLRREFEIPENVVLIGNISALADHKDFPTFLRTAARVLKQYKDVRFLIIGEGGQRDKIEQMISDLDLAEKVILPGFRNDVEKILPELDIFLMTSKTEGLGTTMLDALAAGVPVVATRAGGIPEIIEDHRSGLLSDVGDDQSLAENILQILQSPDLAANLAAGGLQRVKLFSSAQMAAATLDVYQDLLNGTRD